jgi:DNA-binding CsgD family transcriptional regulator
MRVCERCSAPIPAGKNRGTRYCSDNCRKRACDDRKRAPCIDCGTPMGCRTAWSNNCDPAPRERCMACHRKREKAAHAARLEHVAAMYREGMTMREIARALGYGPNTTAGEVTKAFQSGLLRPDEYRYAAVRARNAPRQAAA